MVTTSLSLWGGIWGILFALIRVRFPRSRAYWVVAFLFGPVAPEGLIDGDFDLSRGAITEADLTGEFQGNFDGFIEALLQGELYVNVHTADHPAGHIRGQIGAVTQLIP